MIGGLFVRVQGILFCFVMMIVLAIAFWTYWPPTLLNAVKVGGTSLLVLIPFAALNVFVTMKWGRYVLCDG